jgi:hypothetical protein
VAETNNILELDFGTKLQVTINNEKPVVLVDLTMALLGVSQQFERFVESETNEQHQIGSELYIKEVRSGSIIVELITVAAPVVPLLWTGGSLKEWVDYAKSTVEWLTGKLKDPPKEVTKQDLKQWKNILEPVAKDGGSQMNFSVSDGGVVINQYFVNSVQANAAQNRIARELERLEEPDDHVQRKRIMTWHQTRFVDDSPTGDKALIESISRQPVKVLFENNAVKKAMLNGDPRFGKPWHELAYVVDVRVQTINGVPKAYTILDFHDEDTFDPDA